MCTIGRTPVGTAGKARHQPDAKECTVRREQGRTDCGSKRAVILSKHGSGAVGTEILTVEIYDGCKYNKANVVTRENYEFLRDSYFKYALLLQKEAVHTPGKSVGEGIARLYDEMDTLVGTICMSISSRRTAGCFPTVEMSQMGKLHAVLFSGKIPGNAQSCFEEDCRHIPLQF